MIIVLLKLPTYTNPSSSVSHSINAFLIPLTWYVYARSRFIVPQYIIKIRHYTPVYQSRYTAPYFIDTWHFLYQGKQSNYVYYNGDRTFEALDRFVSKYLRARVAAPLVWQRVRDVTALYVLGEWLDDAAVMRVAFHLVRLKTYNHSLFTLSADTFC